MAILVIPIRGDLKAYQFQIDLEGVIYTLDFGFNTRTNRWYMSIYDQIAETLLIGDIPVLINVPLHDQYIDTALPPGRFVALDETGKNQEATADNFGNEIKLFYEESLNA